ncbi:MAG: hypothetical protein B7Y80_20230 [Hyphomicrobium sp. 32-62-53]|nr:MAG: hypothetical protein B7Y80_20230 [Hyphomicrobium sp. 32-62-53]
MAVIKTLARLLVSLRRGTKKLVLVSSDFVALALLLWGVISFRYRELYVPSEPAAVALFALAPTFGVAAIAYRRLYHEITRFLTPQFHVMLSTVFFAGLAWSATVFVAGQHGIPRSAAAAFVFIAPILLVVLRQIAARFLSVVDTDRRASAMVGLKPKKIVVVGCGENALRFLGSQLNASYSVVALIDDAPAQVGRSVHGIPVRSFSHLPRILELENIHEVIIASGNPSDEQTLDAIKSLRAIGISVRTYNEVTFNPIERSNALILRHYDIFDVLQRRLIPPNIERLRDSFHGSRILVTGAGGSIGSELVMQLLSCEPHLIVLLDNSEVAIHRIFLKSQDWVDRSGSATAIEPVLASILDQRRLDMVLSTWRIDTVFHAAALKHVPLLEREPRAAVVTNVLGTHIIAEAAIRHGVRRLVLVSTDKAVNPVSVMGATKRAAELIVAEAGQRSHNGIICSSVRFGNVLGSSGSVVERFLDQIAAGGPVTVTDPEMTRYFMTVEEASCLVMEAAALARGGEIFNLDMGQPYSILALAKTMINLAGHAVRSDEAPDGIEIKFTGIRPGERLFETLADSDQSAVGTAHPRIKMIKSELVQPSHIQHHIEKLKQATENGNDTVIINLLNSLIETQPHAGQVVFLKGLAPHANPN